MYCDRTDLAVCGSTHIRAPYAGTGGNDVVHSPLFQVAAGIFPDQAGDDVQREQLAVGRRDQGLRLRLPLHPADRADDP